jgi:hypothetical protein
MTVVEVFADIGCPFTHVGLRRLVEQRREAGRDDISLWVRAWPLEIVNGTPMDPHFIAEEVEDIRAGGPRAVPRVPGGCVPATSIPALALCGGGLRQRDLR